MRSCLRPNWVLHRREYVHWLQTAVGVHSPLLVNPFSHVRPLATHTPFALFYFVQNQGFIFLNWFSIKVHVWVSECVWVTHGPVIGMVGYREPFCFGFHFSIVLHSHLSCNPTGSCVRNFVHTTRRRVRTNVNLDVDKSERTSERAIEQNKCPKSRVGTTKHRVNKNLLSSSALGRVRPVDRTFAHSTESDYIRQTNGAERTKKMFA